MSNHQKMKTAFLTGINGMDGSYLAEQLLEKNYKVHGLVRRSSTFNRERIDHLGEIELHYGDMTDISSLISIFNKIKPDEIYNLAAQSHVGISWEIPNYTAQATGIGVLNILEAIRLLGLKTKFYQASTSELFSGKKEEAPQNENTPMFPESPYSVAKLYAHQMCEIYRKAYGMYIVRGILFNHTSPRQAENFITRKVSVGVADIIKGKQKKLHLGNLDTKRDIGYAPEYTEGMWQMMQQDKPDDYVLATGKMYSIEDIVRQSFEVVNLDWKKYVVLDKKYIRPQETEYLCGDYSKAKKAFGWEPKTNFSDLIKLMVKSELK